MQTNLRLIFLKTLYGHRRAFNEFIGWFHQSRIQNLQIVLLMISFLTAQTEKNLWTKFVNQIGETSDEFVIKLKLKLISVQKLT
jgi:hypothetical protein